MKKQYAKMYNLVSNPDAAGSDNTVRTARLKFGTLIFSRGPTWHVHRSSTAQLRQTTGDPSAGGKSSLHNHHARRASSFETILSVNESTDPVL